MPNIEISRLIRSRRRSVALMITPDAKLTVRAPLRTPVPYIEKLVEQREGWIRRKMDQVLARPKHAPQEFKDGTEFFFLGQSYPLHIYDGRKIFIAESFFFPRELLPEARLEMSFWYRQQAARVIIDSVERYAAVMGVKCDDIRISDAKSRWGSCSPDGVVRFSWRLIMAPLDVLEYVVVHELAHKLVHNHSARFWAKVREFCPGCREHRAWLRKNDRLIKFE